MASEKEQAEQLTKCLLERDRYGSASVLQQYVETEIKAMAKKIAAEIVAENPALADVIRDRARYVIREALAKDNYLNSTVTAAIAKTLTEVALERRDDDA